MSLIPSLDANNLRSSAQSGFPVRTVYFSFEHEHLSCEDIKKYFKNVGKIVYFEFRSCLEPVLFFGFVEYEQPEHAAEVLNRSPCNIHGLNVRVEEADSDHHPKLAYVPTYSPTNDDDTQTASEDSNGISVLDLSDDCLVKIFSYLDTFDSISVAKVCPRFRSIASITCPHCGRHIL